MTPAPSPQDLFRSLAAQYGGGDQGPRSKGFGAGALKIDGRIFAALSNDKLLLKLPKERVDALVAASLGERFATGPGRVKKEWVLIAAGGEAQWRALAEEARAFVASRAG